MIHDFENQKNTTAEEPVVIPDECGDSMWDEVLAQMDKDKEDKKS